MSVYAFVVRKPPKTGFLVLRTILKLETFLEFWGKSGLTLQPVDQLDDISNFIWFLNVAKFEKCATKNL